MYVKLFSTLIHSTIWREELHIKVVWITMLAMADEQGDVWASIPGLADAARVSIEQCEDALTRFSAPDPYSRTKDHEGRRIEVMDGGWHLLNYEKYRQLRDAEHRRAQVREAVRRHRAKGKSSDQSGNQVKSDVITDVIKCNQRKAHTDTDTEAKNITRAENAADALFERFWKVYPRRAGSNPKKKARQVWDARIKQGVDPEVMIAAAERYRCYCDATDKTGTEYVKQAKSWLSPNGEGWLSSWDLPRGLPSTAPAFPDYPKALVR